MDAIDDRKKSQIAELLLPSKKAMPRLKEAAQKALNLDPSLAEARVYLAYAEAFYDRNWPGAENEFQQAIRLKPENILAHENAGK